MPAPRKGDDWQTPRWVYESLGRFDLDPCAGENTTIAKTNWAIERGENGLEREWFGDVWCNPPFSEKDVWIEKMIDHGSGVLLLPERGSAPWFGPLARTAGAYWVMGRKINFIGGSSNNNLGSVMFLFGPGAEARVVMSGLPGHLVRVEMFRARTS